MLDIQAVGLSGHYVRHEDHLADVRRTQHAMIAALYWRAGEAFVFSKEHATDSVFHRDFVVTGCTLRGAAQRLEAALR